MITELITGEKSSKESLINNFMGLFMVCLLKSDRNTVTEDTWPHELFRCYIPVIYSKYYFDTVPNDTEQK